jgi:hypothetical protein
LRLFWTLMAYRHWLLVCLPVVLDLLRNLAAQDVPDLCVGDIVLFLHIVPLMAALALRPHAPQDEYAARLRHLDFA